MHGATSGSTLSLVTVSNMLRITCPACPGMCPYNNKHAFESAGCLVAHLIFLLHKFLMLFLFRIGCCVTPWTNGIGSPQANKSQKDSDTYASGNSKPVPFSQASNSSHTEQTPPSSASPVFTVSPPPPTPTPQPSSPQPSSPPPPTPPPQPSSPPPLTPPASTLL